eukprot:scaffold2288_cov258-Pinguiococcus_pyrenoidosus.AAC.6
MRIRRCADASCTARVGRTSPVPISALRQTDETGTSPGRSRCTCFEVLEDQVAPAACGRGRLPQCFTQWATLAAHRGKASRSMGF